MVEVPLTQGMVALVDDVDWALVSLFKWFAYCDRRGLRKRWYAGTKTAGQSTLHMHRLLTGAPRDRLVDHANGNGLDNQRHNLRVCNHAQNGRNRGADLDNTSGYKGVTLHRRTGRWQAQISVDRRYQYLGLFETAEQAFEAYSQAARRLHGEFACVGGGR